MSGGSEMSSDTVITVALYFSEYRGDHSADVYELVDVAATVTIGEMMREIEARGLRIDRVEIPRRGKPIND